MKFTVDTKKKVLTLLEKTSFKELDSIKHFIGEDWKEWEVVAETITITQKEHHWWFDRHQWPYRTYYGTGTSGIGFLQSDDQNKFLLKCESNQLGAHSLAGLQKFSLTQ